MLFKVRNARVEDLTREYVEFFRQLKTFQGERHIKKNHVEELDRKFRDGEFIALNWAIAHLNGEVFRVNGGHTAEMFFNLPLSLFPRTQKVHVDEYEVKSLEELAQLWGQFDARFSARGMPEVLNAFVRVHPELEGMRPSKSRDIVNAIAWANSEGSPRKVKCFSEREKMEIVHSRANHGFMLEMGDVFSCALFKKAPVGAAIYRTWSVDPGVSRRFWIEVRDQTGLSPRHPSRVLNKWLGEITTRRLDRSTSNKKVCTPMMVHCKCAKAWNAHVTGRYTDLKYYEDTYMKNGEAIKLPELEVP